MTWGLVALQSLVVAFSGAVFGDATVSAVIGGVFLLANTILMMGLNRELFRHGKKRRHHRQAPRTPVEEDIARAARTDGGHRGHRGNRADSERD